MKKKSKKLANKKILKKKTPAPKVEEEGELDALSAFHEDLAVLQEDLKTLTAEKDNLKREIELKSKTLSRSLTKESKEAIEKATSQLKATLFDFLKISPIYEHKYVTGGVSSPDFKAAFEGGWHIVGYEFDKKKNVYVHVFQRPAKFNEDFFNKRISEMFEYLGVPSSTKTTRKKVATKGMKRGSK